MGDCDNRSIDDSLSLGSQDTLCTIEDESVPGPTPSVATSRNVSSGRQSAPTRIYCFTQNNWTQAHLDHYESLVRDKFAKGFICGREIAPSTGTPHIQGFVRWCTPKRFNAAVGLLRCPTVDGPPHVERVRDVDATILYCKKDGDFVIFGTPGDSQGKRNDLEAATSSFLVHRDIDTLKREYPVLYVKYPRGFTTLLTYPKRPSDVKPHVIWIYGPTGSNKTRSVWASHDDADIWPANDTLQWFDGYFADKIALLDDFRGHWCKFSQLLRFTDRYRIQVPTKGSFVPWAPYTIYITSSKPPWSVYADRSDEDMGQLVRRCDAIYHTYDSDCAEILVPARCMQYMQKPLSRLNYIPGQPATYFKSDLPL